MPECIRSFFSDNGQIRPVDEFPEIRKDEFLYLYEVIRIIDGKLLFAEDHLERLKNSVILAERELSLSVHAVIERIKQVVLSNDVKEGNLKLVLLFKKTENTGSERMLACITPHFYPSDDLYKQGINAITLAAERSNPNVKMLHNELRTRTEGMIGQSEFYEILLVDRAGNITEGSKSNVFFIKGSTVVTPPSNIVLQGITRNKVMKICLKAGFDCQEKTVSIKELSNMDAAFITGTSPKVLPVRKINEHRFQVPHNLVERIRHDYEREINSYLLSHL